MNERNQLIHRLQELAPRLTVKCAAGEEMAARLVAEALYHLTEGTDGCATAIELELIAYFFESQGRNADCVLLWQVAMYLRADLKRI